jgi:hypothetical protein
VALLRLGVSELADAPTTVAVQIAKANRSSLICVG